MSKNTKEKITKIHRLYTSDIWEQFPDDDENEQMFKEHLEINELGMPDKDKYDDELYEFFYGANNGYWNDLESEIRLYENKHGQKIYIIEADLGLWNGRRTGYQKTKGMINTITYGQAEDRTIYIKEGKLMVDASHHDGCNHYHIRELTPMGVRYWENHCDDVDMTDGELWHHLFTSNRLSKEVKMFNEIYGF